MFCSFQTLYVATEFQLSLVSSELLVDQPRKENLFFFVCLPRIANMFRLKKRMDMLTPLQTHIDLLMFTGKPSLFVNHSVASSSPQSLMNLILFLGQSSRGRCRNRFLRRASGRWTLYEFLPKNTTKTRPSHLRFSVAATRRVCNIALILLLCFSSFQTMITTRRSIISTQSVRHLVPQKSGIDTQIPASLSASPTHSSKPSQMRHRVEEESRWSPDISQSYHRNNSLF